MEEVKLIKNIQDFTGVTKALQDIEKVLNELILSTNIPSEGEVKDTEGKTGDIRITQNEDKDYIFEVRAEDGWKTPVIGDSAVKFKEKPSSTAKNQKKSIDELDTEDANTGGNVAQNHIYDEKASKFVIARPDFDSGWVAANHSDTTSITHNLELTKEPALYQLYISEVESPVIGTNSLIGEYTLNNGNGSGSVDFYSANVVNVHIGHDKLYHPGTNFGSSNVPSNFADGYIKIKIWK